MKNSSALGPRLVRSSTGVVAAPQAVKKLVKVASTPRRTCRLMTPSLYTAPPARPSNQGGLEHDPAVDHARGPAEQPGQGRLDLGRFRELAQDVDQPPHGADEIALVAAEGLLHDRGPVVLAGGPAEHRGHEAGGDRDRHRELVAALRLEHGRGQRLQLLQLALELGALLEEEPSHRGVTGPRL